MRREAAYQANLIKKLENLFPGCFIMRTDPADTQGIPDILILYGNRWVMLEVKPFGGADIQPNQEYYVNLFNNMSYASFVYPENEKQVLHDLQFALRS